MVVFGVIRATPGLDLNNTVVNKDIHSLVGELGNIRMGRKFQITAVEGDVQFEGPIRIIGRSCPTDEVCHISGLQLKRSFLNKM